MIYDIGDIVRLAAHNLLIEVTGVIHDDGRLFVTGDSVGEFEVNFSEVVDHWQKVKNETQTRK